MTLGFVRELLGMGTLFGYDILGFKPLLFFVLPAAGFFCVGIMLAIYNYVELVYNRKKKG
jgi:electron transport complex protein RnfE